ncbi:MAG: hypothetical protein GY934_13475 [Gammaproteobacteria bacterium]|nr:hypothetical protein [Gammaproteobacteria bacterium]
MRNPVLVLVVLLDPILNGVNTMNDGVRIAPMNAGEADLVVVEAKASTSLAADQI